MRPQAVKDYSSVLDVLDYTGCPICTFLRNSQAALLQDASDPGNALCNYHGWGIAAVRDSAGAAQVFLMFLNDLDPPSPVHSSECWICSRLRQLEVSVLAELTSSENQNKIGIWLRTRGAFCAPHALKVKKKSPLRMAALVDESSARKRRELKKVLTTLMSRSNPALIEHSGLVGQVAEYLVSQRGLPA